MAPNMSHVIVLFSCHTVFDFTASLSFYIFRTQISGGLVYIYIQSFLSALGLATAQYDMI